MAFSKLSIINDALTLLGTNRITSLSDGSTESAVMNQIFDGVQDGVMRAYPWNCLTNRTQLAASTTTPAFGFDFQYPLPTDPYCLRVLELNETTNLDTWKVEGRNLLTNASACKIRFIGRPDSLGEIDGLLAQAIAARLAADAAYTLVQSNGVAQLMWQIYASKIQEAQSIDQIESSRDHFVSTRFEEVRAGVDSNGIRFGRAWW
ncbi:MAG: hypothetical protein GY889_02520 [Proteobacteria bacterium]|nr:hypothetical protein [Pseudomonadota bacterium]